MRALLHSCFALLGLGLAANVLADVDGAISPSFGNSLGRAVIGESPGFGTAWPGLRAMATTANGKIFMFGEDRSYLTQDTLLVARLDAASGLLDPGFGGGDGQMFISYPAGISGPLLDGAVVQADGKVLLFGRAFRSLEPGYEYVGLVCRFNSNGAFDASFANGGCRRIENLASHHEECSVRDLALDPVDNGMVVVGECRNGDPGSTDPVFVARLLANGNYDPEFTLGGVGKPTVNPGKLIFINALSMQANGRFAAVGTITGVDGNYDIALLQFSNDGTLDPSWQTAGVHRLQFDLGENLRDFGMGIVQRPDGRILIAGIVDGAGEDDRVALAQFQANGALDPAFGNGGTALSATPLSSAASWTEDAVRFHLLHTLALDDLGRPVVLGMVPYQEDLRVFRFTAAGGKDKTFGKAQAGHVDIDHTEVLPGIGNSEEYAKYMRVERDRIIVGSRSERATETPSFVAVSLQASTLMSDGFE